MQNLYVRSIIISMVWCLNFNIEGSISQAKQKHITIIIPSYNNSQWYKQNVKSVSEQHYENYHIIYIDDCSPDNTYGLVKEYIAELGAQDKVTIIKNEARYGAMANIYAAIYTCKDSDIILLVDGDDWLAHDKVLERINQAYSNPQVWMTYGQFKCYPDDRIGECKDIPLQIVQRNVFREYDWCSSHLRTFYAGLFKKIKIEDLMYEGNFYDVTWDRAFMYPMLEMSGGHFMFIPDVLYVYNCDTPSNDFKTKLLRQIACSKQIGCKAKYQPLSEQSDTTLQKQAASIVIFCSNGPEQLHSCLSSLHQHVLDIKDMYILYNPEHNQKAYNEIQKDFHAQYIPCDQQNFKNKLFKVLSSCGDYVLCVSDKIKVNDTIALTSCVQDLQKTQAYGFYLALGKNIQSNKKLTRIQQQPPYARISDNLFAWQFMYGEHDWRQAHNLSMTLYRTKDLLAAISDLNYDTPETLQTSLDTSYVDMNKVGLIQARSKASSCD